MPPYDWLLFDIDGTLFDFDQAERTSLRRTVEHFGGSWVAGFLDLYHRLNHGLWQDLEAGLLDAATLKTRRFQLLIEELNRDSDRSALPADARAWSEFYLRSLGECPQLIAGAAELIKRLRGGFRLMLITNGLKDVQRPRLALSEIRDAFEDVVISEEIGCAKPSAGIFDEAFRRMGQPAKNRVLIIGDSLSADIRGGLDYGIDACWFNQRQRLAPPDLEIRFEISRLDQLPPLLGVA
ncbi:MAG: YjjG family noncanonical pyrimidine nucleotidase [Acidobacteriota bacterium]